MVEDLKKLQDSHITFVDIFANLDFNNNGSLNYSEFLAATVDKKKAITKDNLQFAFHHFDTDNEGFITL